MHTSTSVSARPRAARTAAAVATVLAAAGLAAFAPSVVSASAPADSADYCAAHLELEAAISGEDPAAIEPAIAAATAAAPAEIADALGTAIANAPTDGPPGPEFTEAYAQVVDWVVDNCGFTVIDALATEYEFGGVPTEVPSGPAVIRLTNDGEEVHEMILVHRLEGTTEPVEELLTMSDEDLQGKIAFVGGTLAFPGETTALIADLPSGDYIALCFLPVGATPELMAEMMASEGGPEGTGPAGTEMDMEGTAPMGTEPAAHYMEGMIVEFTVGDGAAAPATTGA